MIEKIDYNNKLLAIIIRHDFEKEGVHFFTPNEFSQQVAYMQRPKGEKIQAHKHKEIPRTINKTQEVLFIRKGRLKVNFYDDNQNYFKSTILNTGDTILLADGGHGFEMLEKTEFIEVKQGPYLEEDDKIRFNGVENNE